MGAWWKRVRREKKKKDVRQTRLVVHEIAETTQPRTKPNLFLVPWRPLSAAYCRGKAAPQ